MVRVTVAATRDQLEPVIRALYDAKLLHLSPHLPKDGVSIGSPLPDAERFSKLLISIAALRAAIPLSGPPTAEELTLGRAEAIEEAARTAAHRAQDRLRKAEEAARAAAQSVEQLAFLARTGIRETALLTGFRSLASAIGTVANPAGLDALPKDAVLFRSRKGEGAACAVFYPHAAESRVRELLAGAGFAPVTVPTQFEFATVAEELAAATRAMELAGEEMAAARAHLAQVAEEHGQALATVEAFANAELRKAEAPLQCAVTDFAFAVMGWLPRKNAPQLEDRLRAIHPDIYVNAAPAGDDAPIKLKNPSPTKPFEFFLRLYSLPQYGEIDPTMLTFLTFPLFYGMMLGDIGYGLVVFIAFGLLRFKIPRLKGIFSIIMVSAVWTIVFGYFFGEFFGAEEILGYPLVPYIHRLEQMSELLVASLVFGIAHISLAYVLGFANELRHYGLRKAILAKGSWLLLEAGGLLYFLNAFGVLAFDPTIALGMVLVSVVMLAVGEGFAGIIEIPGLASNILSYARLAAVGLASASLALLANTMAGGLFAAGGIMWIMGAFVLVAIHAINILLGLLDSFLQSLRLHYVEMFTKFYRGNGEAYKPFGS